MPPVTGVGAPTIGNITVIVNELNDAMAFYAMLGWTKLYDEKDTPYERWAVGFPGNDDVHRIGAVFATPGAGFAVRLVQYDVELRPTGYRPPANRISITYETRDIDALYDQFKEAGAALYSGPRQDTSGPYAGAFWFEGMDPHGLGIRAVQYVPTEDDDPAMSRQATSDEAPDGAGLPRRVET